VNITSKFVSGARAAAFAVCLAPSLAMAADTTQSSPEVASMRKAAEQGDAAAQFKLGRIYYNGKGVPKDAAKAVEWWRKAAEQGNADAQFNLGVAYHTGEGVPKNLVKAIEWYRKAAEQGDAQAQFNLAVAYDKDEGVPKDAAKAIEWYRKAAEQVLAITRKRRNLDISPTGSDVSDQKSRSSRCGDSSRRGRISRAFR